MKQLMFVFFITIFFGYFTTSILAQNNAPTQPIINGESIDINEVPYQVSIRKDGEHHCGGTIIAPRWILTATHCVIADGDVLFPEQFHVHAGSTDQTDDFVGQFIEVEQIYFHDEWDTFSKEGDVCLLYLSEPLEFNYSVMPIEYANYCNSEDRAVDGATDPSDDTAFYISGWGRPCVSCDISEILNGVVMHSIHRVVAFNMNFEYYDQFNIEITNNMIALFEEGVSASGGDSGGPAVLNRNGNLVCLGISSWNYPSEGTQLPTFYTNTREYQAWIEDRMGYSINPTGIDLYMQDFPWDLGKEPASDNAAWYHNFSTEDIWVRHNEDGIENHQNPFYTDGSESDYVYVRIRNRGCENSIAGDEIKVYWSKAGTANHWPDYWDGSISTSTNAPLGGVIGTITLPIIHPGDAYVGVLEWDTPNPADFYGLFDDNDPFFNEDVPWGYNLMARAIVTDDPMTATENLSTGHNARMNNNIVHKNISIIDMNPVSNDGQVGSPVDDATDRVEGAILAIGDYSTEGSIVDIEFSNPELFRGNPITDEAEVKINLDVVTWQKWVDGGQQGENIAISRVDKNQVIVTGNPARLKNLSYAADERSLIHVGFNFLTKQKSDQADFDYQVFQHDANSNEIVGGYSYHIHVPSRETFNANAGDEVEISKGDAITLSAEEINEEAIYNWYDMDGNLIYTGANLEVSPEITRTYKLEIIALSDGIKDYSEIEVQVKEFEILQVSPNPVNGVVSIDYQAESASSVYLMLVNNINNSSSQFIVNPLEGNVQLDLSGYSSGLYSLVLVCDGIVRDNFNLSKE